MAKGKVYIKAAENAHLRVEYGKGDHVKVYAPVGRGYMVIPNQNRDLAPGTDHAVKKWLKLAGVLVALLVAALVVVQ